MGNAKIMIAPSCAPTAVYPDEVTQALSKAEGMHEEWLRLLHEVNTARSERFKELHVELAGELKQLEDLKRAVNG